MESFIGIWQSVGSTIPGYNPGREWLCFGADGNHDWIIQYPTDTIRPHKTSFTLEQHVTQTFFCSHSKDSKGRHVKWEVWLTMKNEDEFEIIPQHGHKTAFRRIRTGTEEWILAQRLFLEPHAV